MDPFLTVLAAAQAGQESAMEELFQRFYPKVEGMVHHGLSRDLRLKRPWLTARFSTGDVVQEVFRSLLKDLSGFEGRTEEAFTGYLAMLVRNRLVDAIRFHEAARRDSRLTNGTEECVDSPSESIGPATGASTNDALEAFQNVLLGFPEKERLLLRARIEQSVTFRDLAEQFGFGSKSAAQRAFYAAQAQLVIRLRQHLDGEGHPES